MSERFPRPRRLRLGRLWAAAARMLRSLLPSSAPEPPHARVWALASQGVAPVEIARRTRLAHDAVALLLHLRPPEKAALQSGRIFRLAPAGLRRLIPGV